MAQQVVYTDDMTGDPGAEPVRFSIDGTSYVIDLADKNSKKLRDFLAPYIAHATVEKTPPAAPPRSRNGGAYGYNPAQVRKWWMDNEKKAGEAFVAKGRVPTPVVEAWEAAGRP
jgi:hypothetical protein